MAQFQFQWGNGDLTAIDLPNDYNSCNYTSPSTKMLQADGQILASAGNISANQTNLHEVELYCESAYAQLLMMKDQAQDLKNYWYSKYISCRDNCYPKLFCRCRDKAIYCSKTKSQLKTCYDQWKNIPSGIANTMADLLVVWQQASDQIVLDGQQATASALLDQLIAETNQIISLTAYQNEVREVEIRKEKTQEIFAPLMIVLILLGVGFYLYK